MKLTEKQRNALRHSNDINRQLTREAIREALYILMKEKDFEEIRISRIIEKAGVSRSAFYRNYKSKEDILADSLETIIDQINQQITTALSGNWTSIFRYARKEQDKIRLLMKAGMEHHILDKMNQSTFRSVTDYHVQSSYYEEALWNGMIYNIVMQWLRSGCKESDNEITAITLDALKHISAIIEKGVITADYESSTVS